MTRPGAASRVLSSRKTSPVFSPEVEVQGSPSISKVACGSFHPISKLLSQLLCYLGTKAAVKRWSLSRICGPIGQDVFDKQAATCPAEYTTWSLVEELIRIPVLFRLHTLAKHESGPQEPNLQGAPISYWYKQFYVTTNCQPRYPFLIWGGALQLL